jgi:hypothetical protein
MAQLNTRGFASTSASQVSILRMTQTIGSAINASLTVKSVITPQLALNACRATFSMSTREPSRQHTPARTTAPTGSTQMRTTFASHASLIAKLAITTIHVIRAMWAPTKLRILRYVMLEAVHQGITYQRLNVSSVSSSALLAAPGQHVIPALSDIHSRLVGNATASVEMETAMIMRSAMMAIMTTMTDAHQYVH